MAFPLLECPRFTGIILLLFNYNSKVVHDTKVNHVEHLNSFNALKKRPLCQKSSKIIGLLDNKQTQQPHYVSLNSTGVRLAIYRKDHRFL